MQINIRDEQHFQDMEKTLGVTETTAMLGGRRFWRGDELVAEMKYPEVDDVLTSAIRSGRAVMEILVPIPMNFHAIRMAINPVQFSSTARVTFTGKNNELGDIVFDDIENAREYAYNQPGFSRVLLETYRNEYRTVWVSDDSLQEFIAEQEKKARLHTNRFPVVLRVEANKPDPEFKARGIKHQRWPV